MKLTPETLQLIELALREDIGTGDITSAATIPASIEAGANFVAKQRMIVCGHDVVREVFRRVDSTLGYWPVVEDGGRVENGAILGTVRGSYRSILSAERLALNFMQRLSGISTRTAALAATIAHTKAKLLDTRKTTPGMRQIEKYAVRVGGGWNHRIGLYDAVLIKNNHIDALQGDVRKAVEAARSFVGPDIKIEVEVRDMAELAAALEATPHAILLDNMNIEELKAAVRFVEETAADRSAIELEASGGITGSNLVAVAETGVDSISMGALTHSVHAADISLRFTA